MYYHEIVRFHNGKLCSLVLCLTIQNGMDMLRWYIGLKRQMRAEWMLLSRKQLKRFGGAWVYDLPIHQPRWLLACLCECVCVCVRFSVCMCIVWHFCCWYWVTALIAYIHSHSEAYIEMLKREKRFGGTMKPNHRNVCICRWFHRGHTHIMVLRSRLLS